ncbi:hypothetical protein BOTNAR_0246g00010 [Botryotinia narcissicola]|uniref:Uncharacterized protein n=1 Tax=Botryotinia narcissicola TaxID=278944 RepID=A0A4Z1I184_9HELO|nr:hypothetical protein BOTNAR_0246g00010 [Botryotinia narcissicola]
MKFIYFGFLLAATTTYACGNNAYRCKNPDKSSPTRFVTIFRRTIVTVLTGPNTTATPMVATLKNSSSNVRMKARTGTGANVKQFLSLGVS